MKMIETYWFSSGTGLCGIVIGQDEFTGEKKAYIGIGEGKNEGLDARYVLELGSPVSAEVLHGIARKLEVSVRKKHVWGSPACVRFKRMRNFEGELHPCFWCGFAIPINKDLKYCPTCHGIFCPGCGKCMCNVTDEQYEALRLLRRKYCCNSHCFRKGMVESDRKYLALVPSFEVALNYCRRQEGLLK
jgi:hypothetical protein